MVVSYLACSSMLEREMTYSFETSVGSHWTAHHCTPEDTTFYNHHCENLKFYRVVHDFIQSLEVVNGGMLHKVVWYMRASYSALYMFFSDT
jgi:hypothetical protein